MLPFLTAYDPLGGSTGSIDPLGALQAYGSLADLLLPGVTTITTRSRYLSMLCAALANAEKHRQMLPGASGLSQSRRTIPLAGLATSLSDTLNRLMAIWNPCGIALTPIWRRLFAPERITLC